MNIKSIILYIVVGMSVIANFFLAISIKDIKNKSEVNLKALEDKVISFQNQTLIFAKRIEDLGAKANETAKSVRDLQNKPATLSQDDIITTAVAKVVPSVVSIVVSKDVPLLEVVYQNPFGDHPLFKDFDFRVPVYRQKGTERKKVGAGTGFVVSADGYILTNKHVVDDSNASYTALMTDGKQKEAKVIYKHPTMDVALIKIDPSGVAPVMIGNSKNIRLGQTVVAIGNALGEYSNSVSIGIVSGLDRTIQASTGGGQKEILKHVIQTDAAINPGNSGGPLINTSGQVIGINVATVIGGSNISFAIPIDDVKLAIKSVKEI